LDEDLVDGDYRCDFGPGALSASERFRVSVVRSLTKLESDEVGRQVRVVASMEQHADGPTK
jgi:hypothetical protein